MNKYLKMEAHCFQDEFKNCVHDHLEVHDAYSGSLCLGNHKRQLHSTQLSVTYHL